MKKKNLIARLGVLALVFTLVTTSLVSGTYSKYVKEVTGTDIARVAKFAFNLKDDGTNKLDQSSTATQTFNIFDASDAGVFLDGGANKNGTTKLIAPGTTGSVTFTLENLSEVKVIPTFEITESNDGAIPIYYTYNSLNYSAFGDEATGITKDGDLGALAAAMAAANTALAATTGTATPQTYAITWTWGFARGADATLKANDAADTTAGIAGTATVALNVKTTVTQSDT